MDRIKHLGHTTPNKYFDSEPNFLKRIGVVGSFFIHYFDCFKEQNSTERNV